MKPIVLTVVLVGLFAAGVAGAYLFLTRTADPAPAIKATIVDGDSSGHGKRVVVSKNAKICAKHKIPEVACPFCTPTLIEDLGFCRGHDVAEALCTRCNPSLIAAFKAEGDWCQAHGLPESQCRACLPASEG